MNQHELKYKFRLICEGDYIFLPKRSRGLTRKFKVCIKTRVMDKLNEPYGLLLLLLLIFEIFAYFSMSLKLSLKFKSCKSRPTVYLVVSETFLIDL